MREKEFAYGDYDFKELGLGKIEEVDSYGGEGQGDEWYSVKYFKDHNVEYNETFIFHKHPNMPENTALQITYHTDSYGEGNHQTEIKFVEGKKREITVFEPIK